VTRRAARSVARALLAAVLLAGPSSATLAAPGEAPQHGTLVWPQASAPRPGIPNLNGATDSVPDVVGRIGAPTGLVIFTEGNHFPALLSPDILGAFPAWAKHDPRFAGLALDNIVVVSLPQPMIVASIAHGALTLGNMTLAVSRHSGLFPDVLMGGLAPLRELAKIHVARDEAQLFARNRGMALLIRRDDANAVLSLAGLERPGIRLVLASPAEPGARGLYLRALAGLLGTDGARLAIANEVADFPGRLGIQHRDVPDALAAGYADAGLIFRHLALYYSRTFPQLFATVEVPGAEQYASTIAIAKVRNPPHAKAQAAFLEFFLARAREVYPRYGFAALDREDYGKREPLR